MWPQMDKAQRAADMLSGALALLGEDADSAQVRERLGLPPGDGAFGEEESGSAVQRAMQQARTPALHGGFQGCLIGGLGLPPGDGAFSEEESGTAVQRAMQQARRLQPEPVGSYMGIFSGWLLGGLGPAERQQRMLQADNRMQRHQAACAESTPQS